MTNEKGWVQFKYGIAEPDDVEAFRQRREDEYRMVRSMVSARKVLLIPELKP